MNKLILIGFLATAAAVSAQTPVQASAGASFYVEPSVVVAFPGNFDNAVGGAVALGRTFNYVHAIEVEAISFKTTDGGDDFTFTPVLATYKYSIFLNNRLSLVAGASIGATFEKADFLFGPAPYYSGATHYSVSRTAFTSGLLGGISYALTSRVSLDANAHLLRLEKTDITTAGNMVLVTVGVKFRF